MFTDEKQISSAVKCWLVGSGIITTFFLSIIYTPLSYNWGASPSQLYFLVALAVTYIIYIFHTARFPPIGLDLRLGEMLMALFLLAICLNQFNASLDFFNENFTTAFFCFIIYYTGSVFENPRLKITLIVSLLILGVQEVVFFYLNAGSNELFFFDHGSFKNLNLLSCYLTCLLLLIPVINFRSVVGRIISLLIGVAMGTVIILIGSKASFVSLIILGAFWVFKSPLKPLVKLIFASVVVVLLVIYIKHDYNSALGRLVIWKITILNSLDNVISGNGLASFYLNYPTYQGEYFRSYTGEIHEKWK